MNNSDLFATFVSQILAVLHDSFPIPYELPRKQITELLAKRGDLSASQRKASTQSGMQELLEMTGQLTPQLKEGARAKRAELEKDVQAKRDHVRQVESVFDGTVEFLEAEGFVRSFDDGRYQLTLKGFTHLNKRFEKGAIKGQATLIEKLGDALRPDKFAGSIASGTFINLAAKILGP